MLRIKEIIKAKGITAKELAAKIGISEGDFRLLDRSCIEALKKLREADRCFLPYAYKPVLCIASAGN